MRKLKRNLTIITTLAALTVISGASFLLWTPKISAIQQMPQIESELLLQPDAIVHKNGSVTLQYVSPWLSSAARAQSGSEEFDEELLAEGRDLFESSAGGVGCASCHAAFGLGDLGVGPFIRGINAEAIRSALEMVEDMDFFDLTEEEIIAIAEYTRWLGQFFPIKTIIKLGVFNPAELTVAAGRPIQLIIENADRTVYTISSEALGIDELELPRRRLTDVTWTAPDEEQTLIITCASCGDEGANLQIHVEKEE